METLPDALVVYLAHAGAYGSVFVEGDAARVGDREYGFSDGAIVALYYNIAGSRQSYILRAGGKTECKLAQCAGRATTLLRVVGPKACRVERLMLALAAHEIPAQDIDNNTWATLEINLGAAKYWDARKTVEALVADKEQEDNIPRLIMRRKV